MNVHNMFSHSDTPMYPCMYQRIDPCGKYYMPMSKQTEVMEQTQSHVKNPINLTLMSKGDVVSGS